MKHSAVMMERENSKDGGLEANQADCTVPCFHLLWIALCSITAAAELIQARNDHSLTFPNIAVQMVKWKSFVLLHISQPWDLILEPQYAADPY